MTASRDDLMIMIREYQLLMNNDANIFYIIHVKHNLKPI